MSSSAVAAVVPTAGDLTSLRVLRYAIGSAAAMAVAMGVGWQLSFLTPVLALSFLGTPTPRPTLREGLLFVATIAIACLAGLLLARYLLSYPGVYVPFAGLVLFRLFHAKESGAPGLLITWLMIALLLIPLLAMSSAALANLVALGVVVGAAVTLLVVWTTYGLLPDPPGLHDATTATAAASAPPAPPADRFRSAALSTAVVFPLMVAFYVFQWTGSLLVLIFVALLSMQPAFAKSFKAGGALVVGNVIGGIASIVVYNLLVMVPLFEYLVLLTLLAALVFGARVFSGKKTAPLWGMAFSTLVLIIGSVTSSSGDAGSKVYTRVIQIMVAVGWVVVAFGVLDRVFPRRSS